MNLLLVAAAIVLVLGLAGVAALWMPRARATCTSGCVTISRARRVRASTVRPT